MGVKALALHVALSNWIPQLKWSPEYRLFLNTVPRLDSEHQPEYVPVPLTSQEKKLRVLNQSISLRSNPTKIAFSSVLILKFTYRAGK